MVQRTAFNFQRGPREEALPDDEELARCAPQGASAAELSFFKGHYQDAFRDALDLLEPEQRDVLQFYYLDGLTVEEIGALRRVHHSTAARRVIAAREALTAHMQRLLAARRRLTAREFASIAALLRSRIDAAALLQRPSGEPPVT